MGNATMRKKNCAAIARSVGGNVSRFMHRHGRASMRLMRARSAAGGIDILHCHETRAGSHSV
jgi:hypothetical protein